MKRFFGLALAMGLGWSSVSAVSVSAQEASTPEAAAPEVAAPAVAQEAPVAAEDVLKEPISFTEKLHQAQWIQVDATGRFSGSVVSLFRGGASEKVPNAQVTLLQGGAVVHSTTANAEGNFEFSGVGPGAYTMEGLGANGTFVFALNILPDAAEQGTNMKVLAVVPGGAYITKYFARYMSPALSSLVVPYTAAEQRPNGNTGQVKIDEKGLFNGKLLIPGMPYPTADFSSTEIYIVQNGREVAKTMANVDGTFSVGGLVSGVYGLVVSGPLGRGALGFELVDNKPVAAKGSAAARFVTVQEAPLDVLSLEMAPPASGPEEEVLAEESVSMPIPGGGYAGAGSGAGGGGGGIGGAGGLLGLAGLAGAIVALTDDGDNNVASPIVSP